MISFFLIKYPFESAENNISDEKISNKKKLCYSKSLKIIQDNVLKKLFNYAIMGKNLMTMSEIRFEQLWLSRLKGKSGQNPEQPPLLCLCVCTSVRTPADFQGLTQLW